MSYLVLARKYRSRTFDDVVGQAPIVTTLKNAIAANRIHHGYLFCGTRGVGKTSMARILAKALNCLAFEAPTVTPCGECDACRSIAAGEDLDVVEIDAASNRGIDDIRELRSNTVLRPARARCKVYIIDEVHMLTAEAFNALLKTLEEPPSHVKFILATTDPQKVPATIHSRVQRFEFRPIPTDDIAGQLERICREENIPAEPDAVRRIARLGAGSMRDALSLLDQLVAHGGNAIRLEDVNNLIPSTHDELSHALIARIADGDSPGALAALDRALALGDAPDYWCVRFIHQLRDLMVLRSCGPETDLVDLTAASRAKGFELAGRFDAPALVYMISVVEELRRAVRNSTASRALIEAAVVRLAEAPRFQAIESLLERLDQALPAPAANRPSSEERPSARRSPSAGPGPPESAAGGVSRGSPASQTAPPRAAAAPTAVAVSRAPAAAPVLPGAATASPPVASDRSASDDLAAARAEPIVRKALELFDGRLTAVQRRPGAARDPAAVAEES